MPREECSNLLSDGIAKRLFYLALAILADVVRVLALSAPHSTTEYEVTDDALTGCKERRFNGCRAQYSCCIAIDCVEMVYARALEPFGAAWYLIGC